MPTNTEIVIQLKEERAILVDAITANQKRVDQLTAAIDALEGRTNSGGQPSGMKVSDIFLEVAKEMTARLGTGAVFDRGALVEDACKKYPESRGRIRSGQYSALQTLKRQKKIDLAPGGFKLVA